MFGSFTEDNDPHGERDFGGFKHEGQRISWKIDAISTTSSDATGRMARHPLKYPMKG